MVDYRKTFAKIDAERTGFKVPHVRKSIAKDLLGSCGVPYTEKSDAILARGIWAMEKKQPVRVELVDSGLPLLGVKVLSESPAEIEPTAPPAKSDLLSWLSAYYELFVENQTGMFALGRSILFIILPVLLVFGLGKAVYSGILWFVHHIH